jgi:hypothetical protein
MTSDHVPFMIKLNNNENNYVNRLCELNTRKIYNLNKADWNNFKDNLPKTLPLDINKNVDKINEYIIDRIIDSADKAIPVYKPNKDYNKKLPIYILELIRLRKKTKNFIKRNYDPNIKTGYNKLTSLIREEIDALKNNEWNEFVRKLGKNPSSTKSFWNRINVLRGIKKCSTLPTLIVNNIEYGSDQQKADLFKNVLKETFSSSNDQIFDNKFKIKIEEIVENTYLSKHAFNKKDLFALKELNLVIKKLNKRPSKGEDKIHIKMLQNTCQDFRKII